MSSHPRQWSLALVSACLATACAATGRAPEPQQQAPAVPEPAKTAEAVPAPESIASQALAPRAAETPVASSGPAPAPAVPSQLRWRLEIAPAKLGMSGRARCRVRLLVTNDGTQAAAPQAYQGKFTVNGQPSMTADLAFSNGTMDQKWQSLKPNDTAVMERELCADIFPAPGKYTVGFQIGNDLVTAVANVSP